MPGKAVGQAAVELPWLCPNTNSLIALADAPAGVPGLAAADPALAIFLLRFAQPATHPDPFGLAPGALHSAILPETAAAFLNATRAGVLPDSSFVLGRVHARAARSAEIASELAEATRLAPAAAAATVARIAPLGWYAVAAIDPIDAADPLADPELPRRPAAIQTAVWGLDHAAITRRLAARWRLPHWLAGTVGNLNLPLRVAGRLLPHQDLFAIVQLAWCEAESEGPTLGITADADRHGLLEHLRLDEATLNTIRSARHEPAPAAAVLLDQNPHRVPLLQKLLRIAGESRRRNGPGLVLRLEDQIDSLHRVVADLGDQVGDRLRDAKLAGLAELAAGAGHEINNPLAIISSNAQRLLRTESDPDRAESLQAVVRQANRIAQLLRDLMHFARPPKPECRVFRAGELLDSIRDDVAAMAEDRGVRLELDPDGGETWLHGDARQLRHAIAAVARNGIEAAARDGWVRITCRSEAEGSPTIAVEDSGPGLSLEAVEHAFDPFFCGRLAGRGRGLGLPTAWQLVRQNGGDLRLAATGGPTRFVFTLRPAVGFDLYSLRSA